ncbi:hypothetical protein RJ639_003519 [Escallonia herrerae]|uniref:ABC transporter domain-containing protein n=1 Tax=Escallonia herrerae TaxID=1293975 RepID=A0AA88W2W5_9ASTE|nr:hypothetical protein RJ639_003519 [Escallonia herrerae]
MELEKRRGANRNTSRNRSRRGSWAEDVFGSSSGTPGGGRRSTRAHEDEEALRWAALEKLPTYDRLRTTIMKSYIESKSSAGNTNNNKVVHKEVDVRKLDLNDRQQFIDRLFKVAEEDNEKFLTKFRNRIDKVGINLPTVEVRMALLLGPPSSGKTTLLLALAGKLDPGLKVQGEITYNGHRLNEFVPQKTSAYISQNDVHVGEMTVKETLDFSARCQGVGSRYELLTELARREKDDGIFPEPEIDLFMKATAVEGVESSLITDYTLRILGLDVCRDTIVGDEMIRGISGGQKKRVTTGEMIVGPTKTLFMDEISTGLDSSTTFQIVKCLQQIVHLTEDTILMSLLQPAPETFDLFDDIILLSEGQIVYQGPREHVVEFFETCGFKCPERKGTADFLQEVTSRKDQEQYWADRRKPYKYISVTEFAKRFKRFHVGLRLENELSVPYDKARSHQAALIFKKYLVPKMELLKASYDKELLLIKRNSFVYIFKTVQIIIVAIIGSTVFLRTRMHTRNEEDGAVFMGALLFSLIINTFNGFSELALTIQRLPVFYKHRDLLFHPSWAFTVPTFLLRVPISVVESIVWTIMTYYTMGFAPEASRFFKQLLLIFLIHQMAAGIFRLIAGICRTMIIANTGGALTLLLVFLLGGFILPKGQIPAWWEWGYWVSPLTYGFNAIAVNEMFAPRWMNKFGSDNSTRLGVAVLQNFDVNPDRNWFWIGAAALFGFAVLFNILFTLALMYLSRKFLTFRFRWEMFFSSVNLPNLQNFPFAVLALGKPQAIISKETAMEMETDQEETKEEPRLKISRSTRDSLSRSLSSADGNNSREMAIRRMSSRSNANRITKNEDSSLEVASGIASKRGMVLPFTPLAMSFDSMNYFVDMPPEMKEQGVTEDKLQLLREVSGAFRPGVLTALMGISGAGKTTLMDVLAGRKTGGYTEGDIRISGFPKKQETFARISGYCEQNDIHSPQVTVRESLVFSAFLRLSKEVSKEEKMIFVDEVMDLVELDNLKDAIVGLPGITGLSTEQRKRLTIAVELVANPSIIFMDEPTSGLDARAAAIVMRTVRNTVDTGRTVVCTIHQPSIDIFEAFDELLLMKRGGQVIYSGPLGRNSKKVIEYFEEIRGVPKIKEKYNPATWMLEVSSVAAEAQLGIDFAQHYKASTLNQKNMALVKELSTPPPGAKDLYFPTEYSQSTWGQFKSCIWKQWLSYWRSPDYNLSRYFFTLACALLVGTVFWKVGTKRGSSSDLTTIIGAMYAAVLFVGINNCSTVQPIVATERTVFYRERAAGMYSALPYALAQVMAEIPYVFVQTTYYTLIVYAMVSFEWTAAKFFWFFFINFFSFLYFTYYGMMTVSITPNQQVAAIFAAAFYALFNLFSGFFIPKPRIPKWWIWYYWICPVAWTVYGLIVSQYGDVNDTIQVPGISSRPTIKSYVEHHFGYDPNFMGPVAVVLIGFTVFFASLYAYCLKTLNFQMRCATLVDWTCGLNSLGSATGITKPTPYYSESGVFSPFTRLRTGILLDCILDNNVVHKEVDVQKLDASERQHFVEKNFRVPEDDNEKFLANLRNRLDKVGIQLPPVEIRFEQLWAEANCYVGTRALPTLLNTAQNILESALGLLGIKMAKRKRHTILRDVSGILKPSRMTLLLGPPSSGKTTLLLALAGKLDPSLKVRGEITYNGHRLKEFVPRKTSAYISQNDVHIGELTVKETLNFSARFQGVGNRYELLKEVAERERDAGIVPDADVDLFMKATAMEGVESSLITDYVLRLLGLDICKDTFVGDQMRRGISGGQKKRVTTGEMIVGPSRALFMDEISTGLDSSTTYQIVKCMQQIAHLTETTILMSLLQPAPETFDLFDDIILLSEGQIVYQGPREHVLQFFESCGFQLPQRKGIADFLQETITWQNWSADYDLANLDKQNLAISKFFEVTSKKDQEQYWADRSQPYRYISVSEFAHRFTAFHVGLQLENNLSIPYEKAKCHIASLVFSKYPVPKKVLLKASFDKEWLLIKRNSFVYVFKAVQIFLVAIIMSTVFFRTRLDVTYDDGPLYIGAIIFTMIINMFNGFAELSMTIARLPVFYKHRDLLFHPAWTFTLPNFLLRIPISILESIVWTVVTYYTVGYAPEASRFFRQLLLVFLIQQMAAGIFRLIAGICRSMIIAHTGGALSLLLVFLLGGFIIPQGQIPKWWQWAHWISPLFYGFNAMTTNEMLSSRWMNKLASDDATRLGVAVLKEFDIFPERKWYWIGAVALIGFIILFNILFTVSLMYLNPLGKPQAVISQDAADEAASDQEDLMEKQARTRHTLSDGNKPREMVNQPVRNQLETGQGVVAKRGMILPFTPLSMSFDCVNYYVDMPSEMKEQGLTENRLQLLRDVTGAFRPSVLTALMGVSGAGKTTLMDVLAGRKTGGYIEGDIRISGFPKRQATFARISGYCEQNDIHSPQVTVKESLIYSAFLRLPKEVNDENKMIFVDEVMELVELDTLKNAIVGLPGITGLSTEQRKRLTIAVELVANPSIIFMDEPTSGLDARAAAIVIRTVRNTVDTGRTVVCTIHQPSIDIFEAFDELLLMKRGGQVIYSGSLGQNSQCVIDYFEAIAGVPKIRENYNPAAWMLEASSAGMAVRLGINFAEQYKSSPLYEQNKALVEELSTPPEGAEDLYFSTEYSQSTWEQFKSCLWKQWWTYWRSPDYNLVRYFFTLAAALIFGTIFWQVGTKRESATDLTMIIGAMYVAVLFIGINNCSTVQPIVDIERTVFYRERAAGMYSALPYAMAQVVAEVPYVFVQTTYYSLIVYAMVSFRWTLVKFLWFFFISFFSFLYFTYYGMMTVSITPNHEVAAILASAFYALFTLFSGFFIPRPRIPKWWIWYYWICPVAWTVYGLIVSQYGDIEETIEVPGVVPNPSISWYVENHFGYDLDFMGPVAAVLVGFTVFFAFMYAFCIRVLNFQQR